MKRPVQAFFLSLLIGVPILFSQNLEQDRQREFQDLKRKIQVLQQQLEASEAKKQSIGEELQTVELKKQLVEQELRSLEIQTQMKLNEIQEVETNLKKLDGELGREKTLLVSKLRFLNRMGRLGYVGLFFMSEKGDDMIGAVRWILHLAQQDQSLIENYLRHMSDLSNKKVLLDELTGALKGFKNDQQRKRNDLSRIIQEKKFLLAKIRKQEQQTVEQVTQLEEKASRLERLLSILASTDASRISREDIHQYRGVLDWPIKGNVSTRFGFVVNPEYGTKIDMRGIEITVSQTQDVSPVFPGKVRFARWFKGYRNLIVVDHGNDVVSIYGYLDSSSVKPGDWVYPGGSLGKVITGESRDPKLYLEIRENGRPLDPLTWLR